VKHWDVSGSEGGHRLHLFLTVSLCVSGSGSWDKSRVAELEAAVSAGMNLIMRPQT